MLTHFKLLSPKLSGYFCRLLKNCHCRLDNYDFAQCFALRKSFYNANLVIFSAFRLVPCSLTKLLSSGSYCCSLFDPFFSYVVFISPGTLQTLIVRLNKDTRDPELYYSKE